MIIGSISEDKEIEKRISITPEIAKKYISHGFEIIIEKGIAEHLGISDDRFITEGCKIENRENVLSKSDIVLQLNLPEDENLHQIQENVILIGNFNSGKNYQRILKATSKKIYFTWI